MNRERKALCWALVRFKGLHDSALGPAHRAYARRGIEECMWGLGIQKWEGFTAEPPKSETIEIEAQILIE